MYVEIGAKVYIYDSKLLNSIDSLEHCRNVAKKNHLNGNLIMKTYFSNLLMNYLAIKFKIFALLIQNSFYFGFIF